MSVYIVDSNFFIQSQQAHYPLDVAHGFWNKVLELASNGVIKSIDKVKQEIQYPNELKQWCTNNLPADFFQDTTSVLSEYANVAAWATSRSSHYSPGALTEFLDADEADAWLVSFVAADLPNRILVTYETSNPAQKSKIKIPEACIALKIPYVNPIEMFRTLGERF